jgi:periplasmic divalent cation tolerance protein
MADALGPALIWCPFPDSAAAAAVAATLLDEGLIACANILPPMQSLFVWQQERYARDESGVLFKTDAALLDAAMARIGALHPDDEPAVLGWRCDAALPATVAWLGGLVAPFGG